MSSPTPPYPFLSDVLNDARGICNDLIVSIDGQTLTNTQEFTLIYVNHAYRACQQFLVSLGYLRFLNPDFLILKLPAVNSLDTAGQVTLDWTGYNNGSGLNVAIVLPQNLVKPSKLAERASSYSATADNPNENQFIDMDGPEQGITRIPAIKKEGWNRIWLWNNDQIWMPGASMTTDLKIDFQSFLPDFTSTTDATVKVPIMRSANMLATAVAAFFLQPRGDLDVATLTEQWQTEARIIAGLPAQLAA